MLPSPPSASRFFVEDGFLQIFNVSRGDQGAYTCVARTPMDGDRAAALLLVIGERCVSLLRLEGSQIPLIHV